MMKRKCMRQLGFSQKMLPINDTILSRLAVTAGECKCSSPFCFISQLGETENRLPRRPGLTITVGVYALHANVVDYLATASS